MFLRLLIVEPDQEVLCGYLSYFGRATDFELESAADELDCLSKISSFHPDALMLEPRMSGDGAINILNSVQVPVIILSRISGNETYRSHPAVVEYYVKPAPLIEVVNRIRQLVND